MVRGVEDSKFGAELKKEEKERRNETRKIKQKTC